MPIYPIQSLSEPVLAPYRNLKDKELDRAGSRFIAEGENVTRRLLASRTPIESVLVSTRKISTIAPLCPPALPIYSAADDLIESIIGFDFHSGVLACGIRPPNPALTSLIPHPPLPALFMICQEITNAENLGSLIRISAAFGAHAIILGERCCDPWFRQSVRVSMGAIFTLPIYRSENLIADLKILRDSEISVIATVLDETAERLDSIVSVARLGVVFGSEAQGLDQTTIAECNRRVTIPMKLGTDSLNVAVAAGIFLYELTR
jgi:tRNA G18 (ribose-2'-O)-methylase SpoU